MFSSNKLVRITVENYVKNRSIVSLKDNKATAISKTQLLISNKSL